MKLSVVIRTLNEAKHLPALLSAIKEQRLLGHSVEVLVVDSGSTDETLAIAQRFNCRLINIRREEFSFGSSLNLGCKAATGEILVFISGHCIPIGTEWLQKLVAPLGSHRIVYTYGGQCGDAATRFSERQIFAKYFPATSSIPQEGYFCNNANSALLRETWKCFPFDEELTGLEDMHLAKRLTASGSKIAYVAEATVLHLHDENWKQVKRRFEREAIALQHIMPEVHLGIFDFIRYAASAVLLDVGAALQERKFRSVIAEIFNYRISQFWGAYRGNMAHRQISRRTKERFYFPR